MSNDSRGQKLWLPLKVALGDDEEILILVPQLAYQLDEERVWIVQVHGCPGCPVAGLFVQANNLPMENLGQRVVILSIRVLPRELLDISFHDERVALGILEPDSAHSIVLCQVFDLANHQIPNFDFAVVEEDRLVPLIFPSVRPRMWRWNTPIVEGVYHKAPVLSVGRSGHPIEGIDNGYHAQAGNLACQVFETLGPAQGGGRGLPVCDSKGRCIDIWAR
mmetsp:Transcript_56341/g.138414  ORF Transcript_56341/g.138414 Transcript_56341/m.138414 type:complete len:220 (-) Transcript_56341:73-732(-)